KGSADEITPIELTPRRWADNSQPTHAYCPGSPWLHESRSASLSVQLISEENCHDLSRRTENVFRLQESLRMALLRSCFRPRRQIRGARKMDSISTSAQRFRSAEPLLRVQGEIFVHGCEANGERARRQEDDSRAAQDL